MSIIDIDHSHQPLPYLDGRYHLIFNGEIYNYLELRERLARDFGATFETDGDGEAIVAGYHHLGPKIVRELRGMFAFLIWDSHERVLFGARDWFGIKPLYHYSDERGDVLLQREEGTAHRSRPRPPHDVDPVALQQYLTLQYVPEPASMTTRIDRVESGYLLHPAAGRAADDASVLPPGFRHPPRPRAGQALPPDLAKPSRTRWQSTCARTSRSARSCPVGSIRPSSPPWPSGTTRTC